MYRILLAFCHKGDEVSFFVIITSSFLGVSRQLICFTFFPRRVVFGNTATASATNVGSPPC